MRSLDQEVACCASGPPQPACALRLEMACKGVTKDVEGSAFCLCFLALRSVPSEYFEEKKSCVYLSGQQGGAHDDPRGYGLIT